MNDAGIQWLVGSRYSPKIKELNLSNTELTGNSFLKMMPHLTSLILDCCSSLNGQGLSNVATRYWVVKANLAFYSSIKCQIILCDQSI